MGEAPTIKSGMRVPIEDPEEELEYQLLHPSLIKKKNKRREGEKEKDGEDRHGDEKKSSSLPDVKVHGKHASTSSSTSDSLTRHSGSDSDSDDEDSSGSKSSSSGSGRSRKSGERD
jgi:hypothetical protein